LLSTSPDRTRDFGKRLGMALSAGDVVALVGDLGSGKSVMARGILEALGVEGDMPSPSFVIVASYETPIRVNHIDLYRLEGAGEALDMGLDDLLYSDCISVVEWADRLGDLLPPRSIRVELKPVGRREHRLISVGAAEPDVNERLETLASSLVRFT
jgi:tRNA threonylcarbamoyladenosine biosynthesis protein TsaE